MAERVIEKMELWDVLDANGNLTGRTIVRGEKLQEGDYHLVVHIWIINDKGELLIQRRADNVSFWPGLWATTGGSAIKGEDSLTAAKRELNEELGIRAGKHEMKLAERLITPDAILDLWLVRRNINFDDIRLQAEEVSDVRWVDKNTLIKMVKAGDFFDYNYLPMLMDRIYNDSIIA